MNKLDRQLPDKLNELFRDIRTEDMSVNRKLTLYHELSQSMYQQFHFLENHLNRQLDLACKFR